MQSSARRLSCVIYRINCLESVGFQDRCNQARAASPQLYWFYLKIPVCKNPPTPLIRGALVCERQPENNQPIKAKPEISNQIGIKTNISLVKEKGIFSKFHPQSLFSGILPVSKGCFPSEHHKN